MPDLRARAGQIAKVLCYLLAALLLYEFSSMALRWNPFRGVTVPQLPTLTAATNSPAGTSTKTNLIATAAAKGTNDAAHVAGTNAVHSLTNGPANASTNATANSTNSASPAPIAAESAAPATNGNEAAAALPGGTNGAAITTNFIAATATNRLGTNVAITSMSTNRSTNLVASATVANSPATAGPAPHRMPGGPGFPGMPRRGGIELPAAVKDHIQKIIESELLAPVMHPPPMALMGIAGDVAFLRSDTGQTGLVKEGDSLDDLKLLRIGMNRVLVEQNGQKKELMIFSGYGSESLMPKDSTNENTHP